MAEIFCQRGLVPVNLVDQYEILTDGASPVFGTDAIAGIVNIKLRQNIDRPTLYMALQQRQNGGEPTALLSLATGKTFDHGFFGFGAEYRRTGGLKYRDAKFFGLDCSAVFDRDSSGKIRDIDLLSAQLPGTSLSPCIDFNTKQTGILNTAGGYSYYSTPGRSNVGVPNFSVQSVTQDVALANPQFGWKQYDTDGNGRLDGPGVDKYGSPTSGDLYFADPNNTGKNAFDFKSPAYDYQQGPRADNAYAIAPIKQLSLFAYGQRDTGFAGDATLYFEASFNQRKTAIRSLGFTINPYIVKDVVPVTNPTNPCGFEVGRCLSSDGLKYQEVAPFLKLAGDGDYVTSKLDQYRLVVGARGALNYLNGFGPGWLALQDWKYDLSLNYGRTVGSSHRRAVLRDRLETSLSTTVRDPSTGKLICGVDNNGDGLPDDPSTCVPVNLFTEAAQTRGELTDAENDYLFGSLDYRTSVSLLVLQGTVTGSLFKLPGGAVSVVMGGEYRRDGIDSSGNEDARTQNFASYSRFIDPGAKGSRSVYDVFGELGIPVIRDKPFFHNLNLSVAARATHEQYTGTNETWSVRGRYEPLSWFAVRGTYGTSFRSPNTYELFIQPVVNSRPFGEDPCIVPFNAFDSVNGYIPANDYRSKITLDRCRGSGVDPMTLGGNAFTIPNGKELQGGSTTDLRPETSKALSAGFVMTLDDRVLPHRGVFKGVKLNLGATYYEIKVINQLQQGYSYAILNECYGDQGVQQYCGRITRGADGYISSLTTGFINGTPRGTKGVDFNLLVQKDTTIGNRPLSVALTIAGNYEFRVREGSGYGELDLSGIFEYPKLKMNSALQVHSGDLLATWYINYVGGAKALFQPSSDFARTCLPSESITCTPISTIPSYLLNNASLAWKKGDVVISAGLNNVFNVQPPRISNLVDTTGRTNTLLNGNYDLMRRTFVLQVRKAF